MPNGIKNPTERKDERRWFRKPDYVTALADSGHLLPQLPSLIILSVRSWATPQ